MHQFLNSITTLSNLPEDMVYFLLVVPLVVMVGTFIRHIVGFKVLGMYVIIAMTYITAFLLRDYSILSVASGGILLIFIYFFSYYIKSLTVKLNLHYFSRLAIVISLMSILLFIIILILGRYDEAVNAIQLKGMNAFAVLTAVLLGEYFSSHQTQKGFKKSRRMFLNSLFIALILGFVISLDKFELAFLDFPYIIFLFVLLTFLFGRYKGMRLTEMMRFRDVRSEKYND